MVSAEDLRVVEELLRALGKSQRALQMYLPNNPVYQRAAEQLAESFAPVWGITGRLVLEIHEHEITWEETPVLTGGARGEGIAWELHKNGLRRLTLLPGVESEEIIRFLEVVNRARLLPPDASDDLLTLLWEQDFVLVSYAFIEALGDGIEFLQESPLRDLPPPGEAAREELAAARSDGSPGLADLTDLDSTPYFLDEAEQRFIRGEVEEEYRRDIRRSAVDALLDIMETQKDPGVRREVVEVLEDLLPTQLAMGGLGVVALILRELRVVVARATDLDEGLHAAILSFEERLSQPEMLEQLFRVLEDGGARGQEQDAALVLRELKPKALPHILTHLGRTVDPLLRRLLEPSVEGAAKAQPGMLAEIMTNGPDEAVEPALMVVGRLKLNQLVPAVVGCLNSEREGVRVAAVHALGMMGTPSAVDGIETAIGDEERSVRQAALALLVERGGSRGAAARVAELIFGDREKELERSERRALFEAWARFAGAAALPRLKELLEPRGLFRRTAPAEVRACAIHGLAQVRTLEARLLVDRFTSDKEAVVRSAANAVLREWRV